MQTNNIIISEEKNTTNVIARKLKSMDIMPNLKGYYYIREAISICLSRKEEIMPLFSTDLCVSIAKKYNTSSGNVEHSIRRAIEISWNRSFEFKVQFNSIKPTSQQFIACLVDMLRFEY